jgi:hypothetical protein
MVSLLDCRVLLSVPSLRLSLDRLPRTLVAITRTLLTAPRRKKATKDDVQKHFSEHGTGKITEIKLMSGFGFIEYEDALDARDIVPGRSTPTSSYTACPPADFWPTDSLPYVLRRASPPPAAPEHPMAAFPQIEVV